MNGGNKMSSKVLNKVMGFLGLEDEYDDMDEFQDETSEKSSQQISEEIDPPVTMKRGGNGFNSGNKVVNLHTNASAKVIITKPSSFEESLVICDEVKNRKIVVVNTTLLEPKVAQRFLDFISGASYALCGELQEVERGVYILSPSNVEVTNELKNELSTKGLFNWK
jgi:cell division inhibitor SepF